MAVRTYKGAKSKGQGNLKIQSKKIPTHVKTSENQLQKMQAVIQNLLGTFADRFQFFELPRVNKYIKKKKS